MRRICPTITELLAFEAAARHESFSSAATELGVTQGAISKAVAGLERFLRLPLFNRSGSRVTLTDAGRTYFPSVQRAILALESATVSVMSYGGQGGSVVTAAYPTLAATWLVPRLPQFRDSHPKITVSFATYIRTADLGDGIDCTIRYGDGRWPGAQSDYLVGRKLAIIASPALAAKLNGSLSGEKLLEAGLLHHSELPDFWSWWFREQGIDDPGTRRGSHFDQYGHIIEAVAAGLGIGLIPRCLIDRPLAEGRVLDLAPGQFESPLGYYFCTLDGQQLTPAVSAFRKWVVAQARLAEPDGAIPSTRPNLPTGKQSLTHLAPDRRVAGARETLSLS
ncbi:MAG: LysR substrate-binding domain-containing protein [Bosea sp. (in: a-proteobacteria)]